MTGPKEKTVEINGRPCRVWEKGDGEPLGYLAGVGTLFKWSPFLDRLSETRRVIAPSLPGFPGSEGHDLIDSHLDWMIATEELLVGAGLAGADLVGASVGAAMAADAAAVWGSLVKRLVLIGPLGIYDDAEPVADLWAQRPGTFGDLVCAHAEHYAAQTEKPDDADEMDWQITQIRATEAAARILWPLADTRLAKRLPRITQPTLLLWGDEDKVVPRSYAKRFEAGISGPTTTKTVAGAGHFAELDAPEAVAAEILAFLG